MKKLFTAVVISSLSLQAVSDEGHLPTVALAGLIKLDQTFFMGSSENLKQDYQSGANIRATELYLKGNLEKNLSYNLSLSFHKESAVTIGDAMLNWENPEYGFKVSVGQIGQSFSLECTNSGSNLPFLERSLPVTAFRGSQGLGLRVINYYDSGTLSFSALQPNANLQADPKQTSDRFDLSARAVFAPIQTDEALYHFGASVNYRDIRDHSTEGSSRARFSTIPEATARSTIKQLDTGNMNAEHLLTYSLEAEARWGSLNIETEYLNAFVKRKESYGKNSRFHGYFVQANYFLTGEIREYRPRTGSFGGVTPNNPDTGAWQISARHSYINLNSGDTVRGGAAHNTSVGVSWYINKNVRTTANLIHTSMHPKMDEEKIKFYTLGMRVQLSF